jgi:carbon-monoxide dehydrogenase large subunit
VFRTPTFLDYLIPSMPGAGFELVLRSCPTDTADNPGRIKGVGESRTIPAPAAIAAAVENAIRQLAPEAKISQIPIQPSLVVDLIASSPALAARRTSSVSGDSGGSPSIDRA